jgi:hypothetical protein
MMAACPGSFRLLAAIALLLGGVSLSGCGLTELPTYYGRQQITLMDASVNGTDVLAGMLEAAGHEVIERRSLITSAMQSIDAIVWFPNDHQAPGEEVCEWLDGWLDAGPGRTLVYVGRHFDAEPIYWDKTAPLAPEADQTEYRARAVGSRIRTNLSDSKASECPWFKLELIEPVDATELSGAWSQGIDPAKCEIPLRTQLSPKRDCATLLASGKNTIVTRVSAEDAVGELLLVTNGSFLLNLPLVNPQHRLLAGKLVELLAPAKRIVFLSSNPGGPPIDPPAEDMSLWRIFKAWPLSIILLHFAALGIMFCFARWPIFGRPRAKPIEVATDFGEHVEAVGKLLARTRDKRFALSQLPAAREQQPSGTRAQAAL